MAAPLRRVQDGWAALHFVAAEGNLELVHLLLDHGAYKNAKTKARCAPICARQLQLCVRRALLDARLPCVRLSISRASSQPAWRHVSPALQSLQPRRAAARVCFNACITWAFYWHRHMILARVLCNHALWHRR